MTSVIIHLHATIPEKKAATKPKSKEGNSILSLSPSASKSVFAILPKISGSTIKKEKRAAFSRSIPNNTAVAIVDPLLEIPGRIAMAWTTPKTKAFFEETILSRKTPCKNRSL